MKSIAYSALLLAVSCGCSSFLLVPSSTPDRVVHVKLLVDSSYSESVGWKRNALSLIDAASAFYREWAQISFVVDTVMLVSVCDDSCVYYYRQDCIITRYPKGRSDLVIFLSKETNQYQYLLGGLSYPDLGYVFVHQMGWFNAEQPFKWAFHILVHELGHVFGAMHVYPVKDHPSLMEPVMNDKVATKKGMTETLIDPVLDMPNARIIFALRERPFSKSQWTSKMWNPILSEYNRQWDRNNYCSMQQYDILKCERDPHFIVNEKFYHLALYASLCGLDSIALQYADSLVLISKAIEAGKMSGSILKVGDFLQNYYGPDWKTIMEIQAAQLKVQVYSNSGAPEKADEEIYNLEQVMRDGLRPEEEINKTIAFLKWMRAADK